MALRAEAGRPPLLMCLASGGLKRLDDCLCSYELSIIGECVVSEAHERRRSTGLRSSGTAAKP